MQEYTWDDIIINPNSKQAQACIGKKVYYDCNTNICLHKANSDDLRFLGILKKINPKDAYPFLLSNNSSYSCIIAKNDKAKYVPFNNIEELVEAGLEHNKNHYLSKIGGICVKQVTNPLLINEYIDMKKNFDLSFKVIFSSDDCINFDELFDKYCFLDDTPCGKLKESK